MKKIERKLLRRLDTDFENRTLKVVEKEEAVVLSKLISIGLVKSEAFIDTTTLSDGHPRYKSGKKVYPLTESGYARLTDSWWDRTVDHWFFRLVRDLLAIVGGMALISQTVISLIR